MEFSSSQRTFLLTFQADTQLKHTPGLGGATANRGAAGAKGGAVLNPL